MHIRLIDTVLLAILFTVTGAASASARGPLRALHSGVIQVHGSTSPILLAPTRDADVALSTKKGGEVKARFESVRDAGGGLTNATDNRMEFELSVNGGAPEVRQTSFAFVEGQALIKLFLGLSTGDVVAIRRLDFFDRDNIRFATVGVRILNPLP
jgi:hypothetical protein